MRPEMVAKVIVTLLLLAVLGVIVYIRNVDERKSAPETSARPAQAASEEALAPPLPTDTEAKMYELGIEMYGDKPTVDITSWEYIMVNNERPLDEHFIPELSELEGGQYFDSRAVDALAAFIQGARDAGLTVLLTSSYRSYATQQNLFDNKVAQYGNEEEAAQIIARPGSSEHQTGLSVDIVDKYYEYMNEDLADTELSKWMKEHCAEYGFILRYPEDKQKITGIMFEPWHFRYVGVEAAKYIMENGLCLEEFIALYE